MTATPNPTPPQPGVTGIPTGLLIGAGWRALTKGIDAVLRSKYGLLTNLEIEW